MSTRKENGFESSVIRLVSATERPPDKDKSHYGWYKAFCSRRMCLLINKKAKTTKVRIEEGANGSDRETASQHDCINQNYNSSKLKE